MNHSIVKNRRSIERREVNSGYAISDLHPVLDRVYRNRGISTVDELDYSLANLCHPRGLANLDTAVDLIIEAIRANASILIAGDYDADGATGCAVGYLALKAFGARHVAYAAPDRFQFGYGLTEKFVEFLSSAEPDLLITVDNGISSIEGVRLAKERGMSVIVTDHHLPGDQLPIADAIINPRLPNDDFQSKNLAGVGVIFYVMSTVRSRLVQENWFESEGISVPNMADFLDLVALGTVADVVPMDYNNRILVSQGLDRINSERCRYGIQALLESGKRTIGKIVAEDLGFVAGPRLNAAGRIDDITIGIQCLISNDRNYIYRQIQRLEKLNYERREIEASMTKEAMKEVAKLERELDSDAPGICLYRSDWHHGIIGIVASRIKDHTNRPTIIFSSDENGNLRGSGRSINGLNIRDVIADIAACKPELISVFGGHAMAAGLTIARDDLDEFKNLFTEKLTEHFGDSSDAETLVTDGELDSIDLQTAEAIRSGGPWGQGFPSPVFDGVFDIVEHRTVQEQHLKMIVRSRQLEKSLDAIYFGYFPRHESVPNPSPYRLVFHLEVNEYKGRKSPQLRINYMEPC